jgi:lysophospholipase L1-like esterase
MNIAFLGDSITYGYALDDKTKRYSTVLCGMLGADEENYGITGTLIAKAGLNNEDGKDFVTRLPLIYGADVAVIFGGTNDYFWSDKPIEPDGEASDKYFACAFERICKLVKENRGDKPTLIVTPYPHNGVGNFLGGTHFRDSSRHDTDAVNYNGARLIDYVNTMVRIAEREGLPCLDLHCDFPFDHKLHTSDGCHPNEAGHAMLAKKIAEALKVIIN